MVLVAGELRPVERSVLEALDLEVCFRDPGLAVFGLRHGLYPIGDRILEIVSPREPGTAAGRYLERAGDGGYMVIVQTDELETHRKRLVAEGIRIVHEASRPGIRGLHLHPADVGGAIVSIDRADPPDSWAWAGDDWRYHAASGVVSDIVGVEITGADPEDLARRWSRALGVPNAGRAIALDDAEIRFGPGPVPEGRLSGLDLVAVDPARRGEVLALGGVEMRLV
ncbi:MAG: hypothetical protein D6683_15410 [Actinomyces sp.]|nr:MAG: hypothetical protein D6683_15410 [Actinomyces sp.]